MATAYDLGAGLNSLVKRLGAGENLGAYNGEDAMRSATGMADAASRFGRGLAGQSETAGADGDPGKAVG